MILSYSRLNVNSSGTSEVCCPIPRSAYRLVNDCEHFLPKWIKDYQRNQRERQNVPHLFFSVTPLLHRSFCTSSYLIERQVQNSSPSLSHFMTRALIPLALNSLVHHLNISGLRTDLMLKVVAISFVANKFNLPRFLPLNTRTTDE